MKMFFHSCGAVRPLIGDLIKLGVDILHPLQANATDMDFVAIKREFGESVTFCGGMDIQTILPFGSPNEVQDEVRRLIHVLGDGGGYILDTCNRIQADTPVENVVAMFDAVLETEP